MYLKNKILCLYLSIILTLIITVKCQYNNYQPQGGVIHFYTENDGETNETGESGFNSQNSSENNKSSKLPPVNVNRHTSSISYSSASPSTSTSTSRSSSSPTHSPSSSHSSNSNSEDSNKSVKQLPKSNDDNGSNAVNDNINKNITQINENTSSPSSVKLTSVEKTKPESINKKPILRDDLNLIKWSEFDHYGFKIAISTPNVFDDDSVVNIKWETVNNFEPSSNIVIELHTNLTRRSNYLAYQTTETIVIDDNIPSDIREINWNPNIKLKKNENYFIRIWAYTNNNTATMSGLCIWSINNLIQEDSKPKKETQQGKGLFKKIAFPGIGALLCFTVIGHFVLEDRKEKKYKQLNDDDYSEVDSHDGLKNRGESIYYDAIKTEQNTINLLNSAHPLPQPWELEAKRKYQNKLNQSLSDGSSNNSPGNNEVSIVLNDTNQPISLTIEKPTISKLQKIPKYPENIVQTRQHHHHHHKHKHSSSSSSNDSHRALLH
ncbi:hypothetical protein BCR32DRAFT_269402 [Anaeromyces robustus]|uniref:Uncharacterized protein n=1 Tax=Anaeromyces robustus TaxID=1754192 RepID=A0A1Y1X1K7_9FUNG|nr:hypothetical protein BCR32DRAFT_269402 [Anaeromyces robustus]|eukprot:ORX79572.1 hypothetical protein BCR32DRAFT_269402 [Anaeromyces robustus]